MIRSFFEVVLRYHLAHLTEYIAGLPIVVIGAVVFSVCRIDRGRSRLPQYVFRDAAGLMICMTAGLFLVSLYNGEPLALSGIVAAGAAVALLLACDDLEEWEKPVCVLVWLGALAAMRLCHLYLDDALPLVYCLLRAGMIVSYGALVSDVVLYRHGTKQNSITDRIDRRRKSYLPERRYALQYVAVLCAVMVLFVVPSDLNFVNHTDYRYGDEPRILAEAIRELTARPGPKDPEPAPEPDASPEEQSTCLRWIRISKEDVLRTTEAHRYRFDRSVLDDCPGDVLNTHGLEMPFLRVRTYDNSILNEVVDMGQTYRINPGYLYVQLMGFDSRKSISFPQEEALAETEAFSFAVPSAGGRTRAEYAAEVFGSICQALTFVPEGYGSMESREQDGVFYQYFAVCDESAVSLITLYLKLDKSCGITGADYTVLQFIDMNGEDETIRLPDYAAELELLYTAGFSGFLTEQFKGGRTLLEQGDDLVYMKKYSCVYR